MVWCRASLLLFLILAWLSMPVSGEVYRVESSVPVDDSGGHVARAEAIAEAKRQAMGEHASSVHSVEVMTDGEVRAASESVHEQGAVVDVEVLEEWLGAKNYHVSARVNVGSHIGLCQRRPHWKKHVAIAATHISRLQEVNDFYDAGAAIARMLEQRFVYAGHYRIHDLSSQNYGLEPSLPMLRPLWLRQGIQYMVVPILHDFSMYRDRSWWRRDGRKGTRAIELEVRVFSTQTADEVARFRVRHKAKGEVYFPDLQSLESREVRESPLGEALEETLDRVGRWAMGAVDCLPYAARIIQRDGYYGIIEGGSNAGVVIGDTFILNRRRAPVTHGETGEHLGFWQAPQASFRITRVEPRFAVGVFEPQVDAKVGDVVVGE